MNFPCSFEVSELNAKWRVIYRWKTESSTNSFIWCCPCICSPRLLYYKLGCSVILLKNFWSSAEIINLVNYFCCALYCIFLLWCCSRYMCLETVVLTSVYLFCFVLCCVFVCSVCVLFFLTSYMSDCLYNRICGPTKWYDMYVCMYVCMYVILHLIHCWWSPVHFNRDLVFSINVSLPSLLQSFIY
jgi:hypothetical protein